MPGEPDDIRTVTLTAELDHASAGQVRDMLAQALNGGKMIVVADLTATAYCTLEGLQVLLRAHAAATAAGIRLQLAFPGPAVRQLLARTGADQVLRLRPSPATAQDRQAAPPGPAAPSCESY